MKETNMEHFRSEIEAIISVEDIEFAPAVVDGKPAPCLGGACGKCQFKGSGEDCTIKFIKWLMSEYKPEPVLTAREKHFVEFAETGWLARDIDGVLHWFMRIPDRNEEEDMRCWNGPVHAFAFKKLNEIFPFITWEDEEPWSVEELRKLKVADE